MSQTKVINQHYTEEVRREENDEKEKYEEEKEKYIEGGRGMKKKITKDEEGEKNWRNKRDHKEGNKETQ